MKIYGKISIILVAFTLIAMKSDKQVYQFFDVKGKNAKYKSLIKEAEDADIIFFGELHNNPISHWFQLELTKDLYSKLGDDLMLGAEMFEADNQLILNEYLADQVSQKSFEKEARLWDNYKTDYKPLVEFSKENKLKFIATNIPRRYASVVHKNGFEGLEEISDEAKRYIAPLPIEYDPELKGYKAMIEMMSGMGGGHANPNLPKAQAIKDATMAHFILENWQKGKTFIHYNGTYHSNNFEGIVWYLKQTKPSLNIITIASVEQDTIADLKQENIGLADFILCIPSDMTKTY
jgi:uncharacterized iron-regulated protein